MVNKGNKRVRFSDKTEVFEARSKRKEEESEVSDEEDLEKVKPKRGAVKNEYDSDTSSEDEKYKKNDDDLDMFKEEEEKPKSKKVEYMDIEDIEGQEELSDKEDVKMEAFNLKSDMEEGKFDENGNFVWNKKEENNIHDSWLNDVSKKDIEKAKLAKQKLEQKFVESEPEELDLLTENEVIVNIINLLKPKETVIDGLNRLSIGLKKNKRIRKNVKQEANLSEEEKKQNKFLLDKLTEFSNLLLQRGNHDIYQNSYESLVRQLRIKELVPEDWVPGTPLKLV